MRTLIFLIAATASSAAHADLRDLCTDRPGLGTPACTVDPGHVVIESGIGDWTRDRQDDAVTDTFIAGDTLVRVGLDPVTEVQVAWTAYGHVRQHDVMTGIISNTSGVGDVQLGLQRSISGPDGKMSVKGFVTLPTGGNAIGAGDWGAGVLMPFGFDLGRDVMLSFTPEIDAAVDEDRSGRHLAYGSVAGVSLPLTKSLTGTAEFSAFRDNDPDGHHSYALASASFAYQTGENAQFDAGAVAGLNHDSPDIEVYFGYARRF